MVLGNQEILSRATYLKEALWALAVEYQELVRSTEHRPGSDDGRASKPQLDKRRLGRLFKTLQPRPVIDSLQGLGLEEAADRLDDLWKAAAMVFNLVDVSVGVDEDEVLEIDLDAPRTAASEALGRAEEENWTRDDFIREMIVADNVGMLDDVDLEKLSDAEIRDLHDEINDYAHNRMVAFSRAFSPSAPDYSRVLSRRDGLIWSMRQAGEPATTIAEAMGESLEIVNHVLAQGDTSAP